jgi:hypothetical protein
MTRPILVIIPSIVLAGAELQAMLQIRELSRRGASVRLMVLSRVVDPEVLAAAGLIEEHLCRLRNPSSTLDLPFLKMSWRDLSRAAAFARRHDVGSAARRHLPGGMMSGRSSRICRPAISSPGCCFSPCSCADVWCGWYNITILWSTS